MCRGGAGSGGLLSVHEPAAKPFGVHADRGMGAMQWRCMKLVHFCVGHSGNCCAHSINCCRALSFVICMQVPEVCSSGLALSEDHVIKVDFDTLHKSPECSLRVTLAPEVPLDRCGLHVWH
jgi:hypothetical protein